MANKEFNLSVLENVTSFDTPLKECFDYEAILSLIKEEIDIEPTEDEMEYQKIEKNASPIKAAKRKRSSTSEGLFKSPYKKKFCPKLKSPGALTTPQKEKLLESDCNDARRKRAQTLGTLKPRRSFSSKDRKYRSSVSHSETSTSDFADENATERQKKNIKNGFQESTAQQNCVEYKHFLNIPEPPIELSNAEDEISISSKGESTSLATTDPLDVETGNDSFVESSQSTQTSSELRQRLNRRRSTIDIKPALSDVIKEDLPNGLVKSEDEIENFSLTLSPSSKSSASTIKREASSTPPQTKKRLSIRRLSPLKNWTQDNENLQRQTRRKISMGSPLKGLTQELENCIRNGDYVEMCDSETETMSFTFETIQLLNDYEDCNQQANNKIFDKILSSPTRQTFEETPAIGDNLITPKKEQFTEDPLHIDYTNVDVPSTISKKIESTKKKSTKGKIIQAQINEDPLRLDVNDAIKNPSSTSKKHESTKKKSTRSKTIQDQVNEDPLRINDNDEIKNVPSSSARKKRSKGDEKKTNEAEIDEESLHIDDSDTIENDSFNSTKKKGKMSKISLTLRKSRERDKIESNRVEINEDPLHIDDTNGNVPSTTSKKNESTKKKSTRSKTIQDQVNEDPLRINDNDEIKNVPSSSARKKRSKGDEKKTNEAEIDEESLHIDDSDTIEDDSFNSTKKKGKMSKISLTLRKSRERDKIESNRVEINEDPLHIDDTNGNVPSTTSKKNESTKKKSTRSKTTQDQVNEDPLRINDNDEIKNVPSSSARKKRSKGDEKKTNEAEIDEESLNIDDSDTIEDDSFNSTKKKGKMSKISLTLRKSRERDKIESNRVEINEDPLHIDDTNGNVPSTTSKKNESTKKKSTRSKTIQDQDNEDPLRINDNDEIKNVPSSSARKKRSKGDEKKTNEAEIDEESLHIDDSDTIEDDSFNSTKKKGKISKISLTLRKSRERDKIESNRVEINEDPLYIAELDEESLHIDDRESIDDYSSKSTEKKGKLSKINLTLRKPRERNKIYTSQGEISEDDTTDALDDVSFTSTKKKRSKGKEKAFSKAELNEQSQHIDDSDTIEDYTSQSTQKISQVSKRNLPTRKSREGQKTESKQIELNEDPLQIAEINEQSERLDDCDTIENYSSKSAEKISKRNLSTRKSREKEKTESKQIEVNEDPLHIAKLDEEIKDTSFGSTKKIPKSMKKNLSPRKSREKDKTKSSQFEINEEDDEKESLRTDNSDTIKDTSSQSTEKIPKSTKKNLSPRKFREKDKTESSQFEINEEDDEEKSLRTDNSDTIKDTSSQSTEKIPKSTKKNLSPRKSREKNKTKSSQFEINEEDDEEKSLRTDNSDTIKDTSSQSTEKIPKLTKKNLSPRKSRENDKTESSQFEINEEDDEEKSLRTDNSDTIKDTSSQSTEKIPKSTKKILSPRKFREKMKTESSQFKINEEDDEEKSLRTDNSDTIKDTSSQSTEKIPKSMKKNLSPRKSRENDKTESSQFEINEEDDEKESLRTDNSDTIKDTSSQSTEKIPKSTKKNLSPRKFRENDKTESSQFKINEEDDEKESLRTDNSNTIKDTSSQSTEKIPKSTKKNLSPRKFREKVKTESNHFEINEEDDTDAIKVETESSKTEQDVESLHSDTIEDNSCKSTENESKVSQRNLTVRKSPEKDKRKFSQSKFNEDNDADDSSTFAKKKRPNYENGSSKDELNEKSLRTIEDNSCKSMEKNPKVSGENLIVRRSSRFEINKSPRYLDDSDTMADISSTSSTKKKEESKKKLAMIKNKSAVNKIQKNLKRKSNEVDTRNSMDLNESDDTEANDFSITSETKTSSTEMNLDSENEAAVVEKSARDGRRSSERLQNKEPVDTDLYESQNEKILRDKAAKLEEKIAAAKRKSALPEEVYQKLLDLHVVLRHKVLPQHNIKDSLSSALTYREQKEFLKYAPLNQRMYSPAEDEIIEKNWNDFCQDHNWDPENYKPFLSLKHGKKFIMSCLEERKKFVQFLANGLPDRSLFSVYRRFRRHFSNCSGVRRRYKAREDAKIVAYMTSKSSKTRDPKFSELSNIMKRSEESLCKRYIRLKAKANKVLTIVEWNLQLVEKFIKTLLDVTISDELIDLKDAFLPRVVWQKMEMKMKIKWDILQRFWEQRLHLQLFAPEPISMNEIKFKLIEYMHMKEVKNVKEIRWNDVARYFDGYTIPFLRYMFNNLTRKTSEKLKSRDFGVMLEWLHTSKLEDLRVTWKDKCLPRITYEEQKAELVEEDMLRV